MGAIVPQRGSFRWGEITDRNDQVLHEQQIRNDAPAGYAVNMRKSGDAIHRVEMESHRREYCQNAERINAENPAHVEIQSERDAVQAAALHGVHQDQASVNKKQKHSKRADRGESRDRSLWKHKPIEAVLD